MRINIYVSVVIISCRRYIMAASPGDADISIGKCLTVSILGYSVLSYSVMLYYIHIVNCKENGL